MNTKDDYIRTMEESGLLMDSELTMTECADQLRQFEQIVCKMVSGDAYHEWMQFDEAAVVLQNIARKQGLGSDPAVRKSVNALKKLAKETAITMSGTKGKNKIAKTLEYMSRPNSKVFRNVYVSDGQDSDEIDEVVLTDEGVIILEVKKVKSDFTLTEDGKMVLADGACYDDIPLCKKMQNKRMLLKYHLIEQLEAEGKDIPVCVDSFIVFCAPKGLTVHIDNRYHREKYCFLSSMNRRLENYSGHVHYSEDDLNLLGNILSETKSNVKLFDIDIDFNETRNILAEAMALLQTGETAETTETVENLGGTEAAEEEIQQPEPAKIIDFNKEKAAKQKAAEKTSKAVRRLHYVAVSCYALAIAAWTAAAVEIIMHL